MISIFQIIDLSSFKLSALPSDPVERVEQLVDTYAFGLPYNVWFKHNIPEDIFYSSLSTLDKVKKYGFYRLNNGRIKNVIMDKMEKIRFTLFVLFGKPSVV